MMYFVKMYFVKIAIAVPRYDNCTQNMVNNTNGDWHTSFLEAIAFPLF
jgi:hypothetical protein